MLNFRRLLVSVLTICLLSGLTLAKSNIHDWNNLRIVELGTTIVVKTKQGEKYEGKLDYAYADSLSLVVTIPRAMQQIIKLRRDEIKEVRAKRLSSGVSTAIGAAAGLGVGIGIGHIADSRHKGYNEDPGLGKMLGGILGIVWGTVAGSVIGMGSRKIYEAP